MPLLRPDEHTAGVRVVRQRARRIAFTDNPMDFNRDARIEALDLVICRAAGCTPG